MTNIRQPRFLNKVKITGNTTITKPGMYFVAHNPIDYPRSQHHQVVEIRYERSKFKAKISAKAEFTSSK